MIDGFFADEILARVRQVPRARSVLVIVPHEKFALHAIAYDLTEALRTGDYKDIWCHLSCLVHYACHCSAPSAHCFS